MPQLWPEQEIRIVDTALRQITIGAPGSKSLRSRGQLEWSSPIHSVLHAPSAGSGSCRFPSTGNLPRLTFLSILALAISVRDSAE